ncbi:MAG: cell division protein FtsZ [Alistipes sp.]|nr:cell division protein FtsZ [Alistipes sp.]
MDNMNVNMADDLVTAIAGDNISNIELDSESNIMVIGVGGAGGNAVNHMHKMGITGVNFVVCNTDAKALNNCDVKNKVQMGPGLGAGNDPKRGKELATESEEQLRSLLETSGAKMLFIAAGMGGGTGTGASPVIAKLAHELGILTVAVVTMPFRMEGPGRYNSAVEGVNELKQWVDSTLVIDNERLRMLYGKLPLKEAFGKADDVLSMATKGIAEIITVEVALVRVDFADVNKVMRKSGRTHMSMVKATGENRALEVAEGALSSSLLDDNNINGAKEILINFAVNNIDNITQDDITIAMECIQKHASYKDEDGNIHAADIIWGACQKPSLGEDELEMVIVATRFTDDEVKIDPTYKEPIDPFTVQPKVEEQKVVEEPKKPLRDLTPRENVTITPQQDKYRQVGLQKREPAYVRLRSQFEVESDSQQKVNYQQQSVVREEYATKDGNGELF